MKRIFGLFLLVVALTAGTTAVLAKGLVDQITISGPGLDEPLVIDKRALLEGLDPWSGGFIGLATAVEPAPEGPQYTVTFFMRSTAGQSPSLQPLYQAGYVPDPNGGGTFYVPGKGEEGFELNRGVIHAPWREGHWWRASGRWQTALEEAQIAAGATLRSKTGLSPVWLTVTGVIGLGAILAFLVYGARKSALNLKRGDGRPGRRRLEEFRPAERPD